MDGFIQMPTENVVGLPNPMQKVHHARLGDTIETTATNSPTKATNQGEWVIMKNKINLGRSTDLARLVELNSK
jgi:hypothetical protein